MIPRVIDVWGRGEGYAAMLVLRIVDQTWKQVDLLNLVLCKRVYYVSSFFYFILIFTTTA